MDKELQSYYEERFSMTGCKGWEDLMEDVDGMIRGISDVRNVTPATPVDFRKGQLDILMWLKSLRKVAEESYEDLKNESL